MENNLQAKSGIYKITINDYYVYVGQSVDVERRWDEHLVKLKQNKHYNKKLQSVFNKYSDLIKFEIIEECEIDKLDEREMFYIEQFKSYNTKHGLNMGLGGDSNRKYKTREEAEAAALEKYRQWCENNKEKILSYAKQYYIQHQQNNKEYIKHRKQYDKQYRRDNKDRVKEREKQWYENNKDVIRERTRQYYQDNREKIKQYHKEYRQQNGILSWKKRFETRYNLSRPLTDEEWNIWRTNKFISGNHDKLHAIKYLKTLPDLTFRIE